MTYPPNQPPQQPWGQQPDPYSGGFQQPQPGPQTGPQPTSAYQGFGAFGGGGGPQPPKRNTSTIAAIVVGVLIVLGGGGAAVYFLTKGDDDNGGSANGGTTTTHVTTTTTTSTTTTDDTFTTTETSDSTVAPDGTSPDSVRDDYIRAYESKSFTTVVTHACKDYISKYGTDTSDVEQQIAPYTIHGTPVGEPDVTGDSALAKITLEFAKGSGTPQTKSIKVKAVLEDDSWKFCGEAAG
ncbi:hypothetical protein [Labedaea rhizosphaerae]|uniref:Uncharacterized protein n=1 Tax=Labedaea rhizosphaerae TaxID=598644 RepID=A0A4V3CXZ8_LABRH|nr:hypothetical protein [Labedaea rhizosphaerae]TDP92168.1 hypothetical protein EV186_108381 [Labedaea rhizosphaerae]